jgi:hypothetical protein
MSGIKSTYNKTMHRTNFFIAGMILLFAFAIIVGYVVSKSEGFVASRCYSEGFARSTIYDHPTRCFDCEVDAMRRLGSEYGWLGQPAKSYDAEKHMIRMTGDVASAIDTHPIRYY